MPRVAIYEGGSVQSQGTTGAKLRVVDGGASGLAAGLGSLAGTLKDVARVEEEIVERRDTAVVKAEDVSAEVDLAELTGRFKSLEKFGAIGARKAAEVEVGALRSKYTKRLSTTRQRAMFEQTFNARVGANLAAIQYHETGEILAAEKEATVARVGTYVDRAVQLRDNPEASVEALATALTETDKLFANAGSDVLASKRAAVTTDFHIRVADALPPREAKAWLDTHAGQILEAAETAARRKLAPDLEEADLDDGMARLEEIVAGADQVVPQSAEQPAAPKTIRAQTAAVNADPLRGKGRVSETPAGHQARNGGTGRLAIDYAAPAGTPIYAPMSGTVVDKGYDPKGNGHFVRVKHPDGKVSTYLHMRGASPLDVGEDVTGNTVLGGVGSTGKSTGNHLDYSVKDARGRPLNPASVKWEEADLPAPPTALPSYAAERNDKASLYAAAGQVATEGNYSRKQYDSLLRRVDAMVAREDNLQAREDEDQVRVALDVVERLGDGFVRRDQIPNWSALPPTTRMQLTGMIEANSRPTPVAANGDGALSLELMSVYSPAEFARTDIRQFRHQMTPGEFSSLAVKQGQIRTAADKGQQAPVAVAHGRIWSMIRNYAGDVGLEPESKDKDERAKSLRVFNAVRADLDRVTGNTRNASDDEIKAAFDRATIEVVVLGGGFFGGDTSARRFDVKPGTRFAVDVPAAARSRIIASYQRSYGRAPNENQIARTFIENRGKPGFW